jgi:hypothetical protein
MFPLHHTFTSDGFQGFDIAIGFSGLKFLFLSKLSIRMLSLRVNLLRGVIFPAESRLKILWRFEYCFQFLQIEIPISVEVINLNAFLYCDSLHSVVFSPDSHIREIHGFCDCKSLSRIEIQSGSPIQN